MPTSSSSRPHAAAAAEPRRGTVCGSCMPRTTCTCVWVCTIMDGERAPHAQVPHATPEHESTINLTRVTSESRSLHAMCGRRALTGCAHVQEAAVTPECFPSAAARPREGRKPSLRTPMVACGMRGHMCVTSAMRQMLMAMCRRAAMGPRASPLACWLHLGRMGALLRYVARDTTYE